jgi:tetratricopeptide (TPR) repeat protein
MDPNNPIVKLCAEGMEAESMGDAAKAAQLFNQAWQQSSDDFERCIAAHYVARHQPSFERAFHWNQLALECADRVADGSAEVFYPSLYLNLGKSHEDLGNMKDAKINYERAMVRLDCVPAGGYRDIIQGGIERGLQRMNTSYKSRPA